MPTIDALLAEIYEAARFGSASETLTHKQIRSGSRLNTAQRDELVEIALEIAFQLAKKEGK